ncbi:uroporphyrinogen-III synthase [Tardiphaga sp. 813_E8_N1_3]|uniref:uroporphyrinogen-III synthase n=1 Tax=Tardiphaga sp. 813_E8_N1_3 TaxID=3240760 RepID=UPI003F280AD9
MAILVTRPQPDNTSTAAALRARGFEVLAAPMLRFEKVMLSIDGDADFGAVVVTSANALRALADQPAQAGLLRLPLFAVGDRTAEAARNLGFAKVISAEADAAALRDLLMESSKNKLLNKNRPLLYLAGADLARDLAGELGARGFTVVTQTIYRMMPVADLPHDVSAAFVAGKVEAVLHYSRRSARAFFQAAGLSGVEIAALAVPHYCLSAAVGAIAHDAGASQVVVAQTPDENALFAALDRAIVPLSR